MAELTLSEAMVLNGASFDAATYLGGLIADLDGRWRPEPLAQSDGTHLLALIDLWASEQQITRAAFPGYVYRDSADTQLQYSVRPFTVFLGGMTFSYAGATALGPLSAGVANYVYADFTSTTVTIANQTGGWPTVPHLALATITPPGSGYWLPTNMVPIARQQSVLPRLGGMVYSVAKEFTYQTASPVVITRVPAGGRVLRTLLLVDTAFNGSSPAITIGDAGQADRHMTSAEAAAGSTGTKAVTRIYKHTSATDVRATLTLSGASQGAATAIVEVQV